jgi:hypothetical protein
MAELTRFSSPFTEKSAIDLALEAFAHDELQLCEALHDREAELIAYREMAHVAFGRVAELTEKLRAVKAAYYRLQEEYRQLLHGGAR